MDTSFLTDVGAGFVIGYVTSGIAYILYYYASKQDNF